MGHSYTNYKGKGILSKDYKVITWLFLICREVEPMNNVPDWLKDAQRFWYEEARNSINGLVSPELDRFIVDYEREQIFIDICQRVYNHLLSFGDTIPSSFLNEVSGFKPTDDGRVREDNMTELYLQYGRALLDLLRGNQVEECIKV